MVFYHIVGITPEAPTLKLAFHGREPKKRVVITDGDLKEVHQAISGGGGKIDFAMFGI